MNLLTPAQLAKKYPISRSTIYSACQGGLLPFYRVPARNGAKGKYLIDEADFLAWLARNRHEAGASVPPDRPVKPQVFRHLTP
jgi:excisionase family DNA binding protein